MSLKNKKVLNLPSEKTGVDHIYSKELKLKACDMYLNKGYSCEKIVKELNIREGSIIRKWVALFQEKGDTAFDIDSRGIGKGLRRGRPRKSFNSMEAELEFLRMENEYLKKLYALQREKK
jgi:transposase-like protein